MKIIGSKTVFILSLLVTGALTLFTSCEKDETIEPGLTTNEKEGEFWLYSRIGDYPDQSDLIAEVSREELENPNFTFTLLGNGAEVQEKITYGQVVKDGYYYCVSKDERFGKYNVENGELIAEMEVPYAQLYNAFSYTWKDDATLLIFGPNGDGDKLVYSEIDINTLEMKNGEIEIDIPDGFNKFSTDGALYRDGKVFVGYSAYEDTNWTRALGLRLLVMDANNYTINKTITSDVVDVFGMSGRFQPGQFIDENNDIYFVGGTQWTNEDAGSQTRLLRIKSGETEIDPSYIGYEDNNVERTLNGLYYLENGTAIARLRGDDGAEYGVLNLSNGTITNLAIPAGDAGSAVNVALDLTNDKAYLMTNIDREVDNNIYVYKISSGALTKGMVIPSGYTWLLRLDYVVKK